MDAPLILSSRRSRRLMEHSHGWVGLGLAACLGRRWLVGWAVHVALDTLSHSDGGATGKTWVVKLP